MKLIKSIKISGYSFQTMEEFISAPEVKAVILRHDVDERPHNAMKLASAEHTHGIAATYYFRIVKLSNDPDIIEKIARLGHEIGYHYEDYAVANGNMEIAMQNFQKNLEYFRKFYPVKTVCMHGSSMSGFDNREMWQKNNLADFGLIGEPYLSIDYSKILYLTDTGRCWDGYKYNVRDNVKSNLDFTFHRTNEIIEAFRMDKMPDQVILQSHTLWTDSLNEWLWLEIREKIRNNLKSFIVNMPFLKRISYKLIQSYSK